MKRLLISLSALALLPAAAQRYVIVSGNLPYPIESIEKITYDADDQFDATLLPGRLAADPETTLFSQALQLTGLADTLRAYWHADYGDHFDQYYDYSTDGWAERAFYPSDRPHSFTVFAETDGAFRAQGINSLGDLKAYAATVYDEAFPEDAAVSDPTDRRHSLNRFVAYHILGHGAGYYRLTGYDGDLFERYYNRKKADIAAWYATLMPGGSLKCSYPDGTEAGLYLNRRGLQNGPDKYGVQVRGAMIAPSATADEGGDGYTHTAYNGYYFHIDRVLAYDQTARQQVLGGERWRVDCTALSPDILNADTKKRELMMWDTMSRDDRFPNTTFDWNSVENFEQADDRSLLIARRSHTNFWCYEGDEMLVMGNGFDFSIQLPPLPAGEWEVRLGCTRSEGPKVEVWLDGRKTADTLDLFLFYYDGMTDAKLYTALGDAVKANMLAEAVGDDGRTYIEDRVTGERIVKMGYQVTWRYDGTVYASITGRDPETNELVDWSDRFLPYLHSYHASLPRKLHGPEDCGHFNPQDFYYMSFYYDNWRSNNGVLRSVLGRVTSDGRTPISLRLRDCGPLGENTQLRLDFLEFCPKAIYDNTEIPEDDDTKEE